MSDDRWGWGADEPTDPNGFPRAQVPPRDIPSSPAPEPIRSVPVSEWSAALVDLAVQSTREQAQAEARRRRLVKIASIVGAVVAVLAVVGGVVVYFGTSSDSSPKAGGTASAQFCATGTSGEVTTVSKGGDQKTPVGAVATFLDAVLDSRNAANARATMSETAVAPTVAALQQFISALPTSTDGWCGQITTTESTARLLVTLRVRTENGAVQVGRGYTFYVSAPQPDRWTIDAIVTGS